ncbi:MAG: group 1 truncated hemoglobin [Rhodospirillales bacterium]
MRLALPVRSLSIALLLAVAACTGGGDRDSAGRQPGPPPVYDRIGGQATLIAVADDFMTNVASDTRIARRFQGIDSTRFKQMLVQQMCVSTGGPCKYTGRPMKDVHAGLGISDAEFNAMAQDLRRAMARRDIPVETQVEFVAALEPLRDDVVSPLRPVHSVVATPMAQPMAARPDGGRKPVATKKPGGKKPVTAVPAKKPAAKKPPTKPAQ